MKLDFFDENYLQQAHHSMTLLVESWNSKTFQVIDELRSAPKEICLSCYVS